MLQTGFQHVHVAFELFVGFVDGLQGDGAVVVLEILVEEHGVVAFFLGLDFVPVGESGEAAFLEIVVHVQIKVCGVELFVDLIVEQIGYFFV